MLTFRKGHSIRSVRCMGKSKIDRSWEIEYLKKDVSEIRGTGDKEAESFYSSWL